jgi:hypothetical protein
MHEQADNLTASLEAIGAEIARAQPPLDPALRDRLIFAAGMSAGRAKRPALYGWAGVTLGLVLLSLVGGRWWGANAGQPGGPEVAVHPAIGAVCGSMHIDPAPAAASPAARTMSRNPARSVTGLCSLDRLEAWLLDAGDSQGASAHVDVGTGLRSTRPLTPIRLRELLSSL